MGKTSAEEIRALALSLEGSVESPHFENSSFRLKGKIFATYDAQKHLLTLKFSKEDQHTFSNIPGGGFEPVPNKWGLQGWTNAYPDHISSELLRDALECAWREVGGISN